MAGRPGPNKKPRSAVANDKDAVEFEFKCYCIFIRDLEPNMPEEPQFRERLLRWIHLLVDPLTSAQDIEFRVKRNRYLFMICTALMSGNHLEFMKVAGTRHIKADAKRRPVKVAGMKSSQLADPIADAQGIPVSIAKSLDPSSFETIDTFPEWQREKHWDIRLQSIEDAARITLKDAKSRIQAKKRGNLCSVHNGDEECPQDNVDKKVGNCLDNQFGFLLMLAESYQQLMATEKELINLWLQQLAKVDKNSCVEMKGIRNDYIMLLVGYLVNNELKGPFEDLPTEHLQPLTQAIATYMMKRKVSADGKGKVPLSPVDDTVEAFMNSVPKVEEGAFAILSLSGNLFTPQRR